MRVLLVPIDLPASPVVVAFVVDNLGHASLETVAVVEEAEAETALYSNHRQLDNLSLLVLNRTNLAVAVVEVSEKKRHRRFHCIYQQENMRQSGENKVGGYLSTW